MDYFTERRSSGDAARPVRLPEQEVQRLATLGVAFLLLAGLVTSCMQLDGKKNEARISNQTGVAIEIFWTAAGAEDVHYKDVPPGQEIGLYEHVSECARYNMVARTIDGTEVARTETPLCPGDRWSIGPEWVPSQS